LSTGKTEKENVMKKSSVLGVWVVLAVCSSPAQELAVEIRTPAYLNPQDLSVRLEPVGGAIEARSDFRNTEDGFLFRNLPAGTYLLHVTNRYGSELISPQAVTVSGLAGTISVEIPPDRSATPPGGPVSVARLRHKPPKDATKAVERAQRYSEAGDWTRAAEELEKAVSKDPGYSEAHINLGVQYVRLKRLPEAQAELERAIALDPASALAYSNLAETEILLGDRAAAERSVRKAVDLDGSNAAAQMIFGWLLAAHPETRAEGIKHLEYAARTIPAAARILAQLQR
jgi:tetratricopeptide (TPR) repeat protein